MPPMPPQPSLRSRLRAWLASASADLSPGPRLTITNNIDQTTPPSTFTFTSSYLLTDPMASYPDSGFQSGCSCRPNMGQSIGCEYPQKCECLGDATPLAGPGRKKFFPYQRTHSATDGAGTVQVLSPKILDTRNVVYECNALCGCGPRCKNKLAGRGERTLKLDIFKTRDRGWGLRSREPIRRGQFIDVYYGELISEATATLREGERGAKAMNFLFALDKFRDAEDWEARRMLSVDGERSGSVARFANHSCRPNCRQFAVSTLPNLYVYSLALFAIRDIGAWEELTFDYLDGGGGEGEEGEEGERCLCASRGCRKMLWQ